MPMPMTFSRRGLGGDGGGESGIDAAAESDDGSLEAAFVDVIAGAKDESVIGAGFVAGNLRVDIAGEDEGVISPMSRNPQDMGHPRIFTGVWGAVEREKDQVFLEGLGLSDGLPSGSRTRLEPSKTRLSLPPT